MSHLMIQMESDMAAQRIGIIGVGRLGLAYALVFEKNGFDVIASSYRADYVDDLQNRRTDSQEPGMREALSNAKNIRFTTDNRDVIENCDVVYVMVATPSTISGDYDMSAIWQVANDYVEHPTPVKDKILIIGSTVNPGITQTVQNHLQSRGVHVVYAPTFVAQGSVLKNIVDPHTISIGTNDAVIFEKCKEVFQQIVKDDTPIYRMQSKTAEILKLAGNCRSTMMISYFNMIGQILLEQGLSDDLETANKYLNFVKQNARYRFGFGYGGPCYPRDNSSMVYFAEKEGLSFPLGKLVDEFNKHHVGFLVDYLFNANTDRRPFYFSYISYKPGIDMFNESQQLEVCKELLAKGSRVQVADTEFLTQDIKQELHDQFGDLIEFVDKPTGDVYNIDW